MWVCRMFARTIAAAPSLSGCWIIPTPILLALPSIPNEIIPHQCRRVQVQKVWIDRMRKVRNIFTG